jgi:hypothetical protein
MCSSFGDFIFLIKNIIYFIFDLLGHHYYKVLGMHFVIVVGNMYQFIKIVMLLRHSMYMVFGSTSHFCKQHKCSRVKNLTTKLFHCIRDFKAKWSRQSTYIFLECCLFI